jgi:ribosomal protein S18 acetylase RimI-like enzyme
MQQPTVRPARIDDCEIIARYNCELAWETEQTRLDAETVLQGVQAVLADAGKGRYFVACCEEQVVGQLMHTREWSDWRNGDIWWLQSVYVAPSFRGRGVFRTLYQHLAAQAQADPGVVGLRLYVESDNTQAQQTYRQLGLREAGYFVMEQWNEHPRR